MICAKCLKVQADNPDRTPRELSPVGSFEAVTTVNGTALCKAHALMVNSRPKGIMKPIGRDEIRDDGGEYYNNMWKD